MEALRYGRRVSAPPNDESRLVLFLDLVEDYRSLANALPADVQFTLGSLEPRQVQDHWHRLLRAFALRKFVSPADHVTVARVVSSLDALMPQRNSQVKEEMEMLVAKATRGVAAFGSGGVDGYDHADNITMDALYGRYLHGDYDRWERSRARPQLYEEMALWSWVSNVESLVFSIERSILALRADGVVDIADTSAGGQPH